MAEASNANPAELAHFSRLASRWWDPEGDLRTLHDINPVRLDLIDRWVGLAGKNVLDVGCGGGLLSEAMARRGAVVLGIDLADDALAVARLHLLESGLTGISYRHAAAEELAREQAHGFDLVTCMELLEHVPDPATLVSACARLARPGGSVVFSTLNRNLTTLATAIIGAEYLTGLVPRGTHRYEQLIRPSELDAWARQAGMTLIELCGGNYDPIRRLLTIGVKPTVNYFAHFQVPGAPTR